MQKLTTLKYQLGAIAIAVAVVLGFAVASMAFGSGEESACDRLADHEPAKDWGEYFVRFGPQGFGGQHHVTSACGE